MVDCREEHSEELGLFSIIFKFQNMDTLINTRLRQVGLHL